MIQILFHSPLSVWLQGGEGGGHSPPGNRLAPFLPAHCSSLCTSQSPETFPPCSGAPLSRLAALFSFMIFWVSVARQVKPKKKKKTTLQVNPDLTNTPYSCLPLKGRFWLLKQWRWGPTHLKAEDSYLLFHRSLQMRLWKLQGRTPDVASRVFSAVQFRENGLWRSGGCTDKGSNGRGPEDDLSAISRQTGMLAVQFSDLCLAHQASLTFPVQCGSLGPGT